MLYHAYFGYRQEIEPGQRRAAFGTGQVPAANYEVLRRACEHAAQANRDLTYRIVSRDGSVDEIYGWLEREQLTPAFAEMEKDKQKEREDHARRPPVLLNTICGLRDDLQQHRSGWLALDELAANNGQYGGEPIGLPSRSRRLITPLAIKALDKALQRVRDTLRPHASASTRECRCRPHQYGSSVHQDCKPEDLSDAAF